MRVLGIDPGLRRTGWGVIEAEGNRLTHVANGVIATRDAFDLAHRLVEIRVLSFGHFLGSPKCHQSLASLSPK